MSWLRMHLKDYKHVTQVFSLVKVTLSMMNPKICYYFSIQHFHNANWSYKHNRRTGI